MTADTRSRAVAALSIVERDPLPSIPEASAATTAAAAPATDARIRVLHFHSSKGLYGPERWTHLVLRSLTAAPVSLEVLTIGTKPGYDDFARFLQADGHAANHLPIGGKIGPAAIRAVRRFIVDRRIDIIHTHGFKTDILAYLATRGLGVGLVTTPHGWCDHESLRIRAYETLGRWFLHGFDRVYPVSAHQIAVLRRYRLHAGIRLMRNAVDIAALDGVHRQRSAEPPASPRILFVGRLCREKGLLDLIRALGILRGHPGGIAQILGEGPARSEAQDLAAELGIADRVQFAGFQKDVRPFLRDATLLALPSYSEGIPRVVMEAFAAGVPVVGTDIPGLRELVTHGESGLLIQVGDSAALSSAIDSILADPALGRRLATRARDVVERNHSPARLCAELCDEYLRLAPKDGARGR